MDDGNLTANFNTSSKYHDYGLPVVATLSFFLVTSMIMALVGNVMVIITILRHRGMRTRTNMLLGNLAVADILVAVLDMPIALITIINHDWVFPETFCVFNGFAVGLGLMLSVHTLMWISIHKFFSITRPFARTVTPFQIALMMVAAWVWTIVYNLTATPLIGMTQTVYKKGSSQCGPAIPKHGLQFIHSSLNTVVNLVIPMIVMFYCYYKIFEEVKTHLERMRDFADVGMRNSFIQQKQITTTLFIVLVVFFLFWLPYIIYSMSLVFCGEACVPLVFNPISYLCGYMNSACNPVIYALRSPSFRRGFKEIIFGTSTRIPGSSTRRIGTGSTHRSGSIMVTFKKSIFRPSVKGRTQPSASHKGPNTTRRTSRAPRTSAIPALPPPPLEVNGKPCLVEVPEPSSEGPPEAAPLNTTSDSSTPSDTPATATERELLYLPWQPLQPQFPINHLSKSCQEIATATSGTIHRSASAGALSNMAQHTEKAQKEADVTSKRRHKSEVHRPLMWQASVDHLSVPSPGRRRQSHGERMRLGQHQQAPQQTHLRVGKIIRNFRKSIGDLFSIEEH